MGKLCHGNELIEKEKTGVCPGLYETGDRMLADGGQFDLVFLDIQMEGWAVI